jgi:hypothetical protein
MFKKHWSNIFYIDIGSHNLRQHHVIAMAAMIGQNVNSQPAQTNHICQEYMSGDLTTTQESCTLEIAKKNSTEKPPL